MKEYDRNTIFFIEPMRLMLTVIFRYCHACCVHPPISRLGRANIGNWKRQGFAS